MFINDLNLRFILSSFMCDDLSLESFELMIYEKTSDFENQLGEENYLNLISMDFRTISNFEAKFFLYSINIDNIYFDEAIYLCAKFKLKLISLTEIFNYLDAINDEIYSKNDNKNLNIYFSGLGIDTTGYSSEINRLGEDAYRDGAMNEIEKLINHLDKNHILIDYFKMRLLEKII